MTLHSTSRGLAFSSLLLLAGCSRVAADPLAPVDPPGAQAETEATGADEEKPTSGPPPLEPAVDWPQQSYRFPAEVAYIEGSCIVTVEGVAYCSRASGYERNETPDVALMRAAALSPGCKSAPDGGAACTASYEAVKRDANEEVDGAPIVDSLGPVRWTKKHVFGIASDDPYARKLGGRPPKRAEGVVEVKCDGEPGLIWLHGGTVDSRCGYDTSDWKDIVQISGRSGTLCGVSRTGELRCTSNDEAKLPTPLQGVAEVRVSSDVCIRMRDGSGECFGSGLDRVPSIEAEAGIGPSRRPLRIEGLTAMDLNRQGICVATGKRLFCAGGRAREDGAVGVRGLPAMVSATPFKDGGAGIDTLGHTVVWGEATNFEPRRSDVRLTAVGAGVAVDEHGHLLEYRATSGHWLQLVPDFWPNPPAALQFTTTSGGGCTRSGEEIRCWKDVYRGPFELDTSERTLERARQNFDRRVLAFKDLENIRVQDTTAAVTQDGRVWFNGSKGAWSDEQRWIPQVVQGGPVEPKPQLEQRLLPPASPRLSVGGSTSDIRFDRVSGYCASSGAAAYCFGRGSDKGGHELRRTPVFDGFSDVSSNGECALVKSEVRCRGKAGAVSTHAVALFENVYVEDDGSIRGLHGGKVRHRAKLPPGTSAVSVAERHWVALESNGAVTLVEDRILGSGSAPEFPSTESLRGSEAIASAPDRICGLRDGTVTCVDEAEADSRTAGKAWTVNGIKDATKLVMGGDDGVGRGCVLTKKGRVVCFGRLFSKHEPHHPIASGLVPTVAHGDEPATDLGVDGVTDIWLGPRGGLMMARHGKAIGHNMSWATATAPACFPKATSVGYSFLRGGRAVDVGGDVWSWFSGGRARRIDLRGAKAQVVSSDGEYVLTTDGAVLKISRGTVWSKTSDVWPGSTEGVRVDAGCAWEAGRAPRCIDGPVLTDVVAEMAGGLALTDQGTLMCQGDTTWSACRWEGEGIGASAQPLGPVSKLREVAGLGTTVEIDSTQFVCSGSTCTPYATMPDRALFDEIASTKEARIDSDGQTYRRMPTECYGQTQTELSVAAD